MDMRISCRKAQYDLKDPHSLADFLRDANIRLVRAPRGIKTDDANEGIKPVPKPLKDLKPNRNLYGDRGWCRAEVEWSSLRTINLQHQRICPADADEVKSDGRSCRVPMTPQKFEATMKDSKFTHKADSEIVISLQAKVFQEKVSACESLVLEGISAAQMAALAEVLPFYGCLKSLKLSDFECNEEEAMAFSEARDPSE
eukprot:Skav215326  [mRNA]  locus=scaffold2135:43414:45030:- [translate_table: standard]